jgi:hypothetical protein
MAQSTPRYPNRNETPPRPKTPALSNLFVIGNCLRQTALDSGLDNLFAAARADASGDVFHHDQLRVNPEILRREFLSQGRPATERLNFFSATVRAQVTALACTQPAGSGKPLSRWSSAELAAQVIAQKIVPRISPSTIRLWLRAERIRPWPYHCWQRGSMAPLCSSHADRAPAQAGKQQQAAALEKGRSLPSLSEMSLILVHRIINSFLPPDQNRAKKAANMRLRLGANLRFRVLGAIRVSPLLIIAMIRPTCSGGRGVRLYRTGHDLSVLAPTRR